MPTDIAAAVKRLPNWTPEQFAQAVREYLATRTPCDGYPGCPYVIADYVVKNLAPDEPEPVALPLQEGVGYGLIPAQDDNRQPIQIVSELRRTQSRHNKSGWNTGLYYKDEFQGNLLWEVDMYATEPEARLALQWQLWTQFREAMKRAKGEDNA